MKKEFYENAQIYLTECTHPEFSYVKYVGLDCKRDRNYLGSSVTLKWIINRIGRQFFHKTILQEVSGTMSQVCALEQQYIIKYDAVNDPDFLNMNGGKARTSIEDQMIDMDYVISPISRATTEFIAGLARGVYLKLPRNTHNNNLLVFRVLSLVIYGYLNYDQQVFNYCKYQHYGSGSPDEVQGVLGALCEQGLIDAGYNRLTITEKLMDMLPLDVNASGFSISMEY